MNAVVFPGQGAQYRGMGKNLYDHFPQAQKMFSCVEDLFAKKITDICFQGHDLDDIYNQQLAIVATSLAVYVVFREKGVKIDFFSGLSLGEYTCLYPSG